MIMLIIQPIILFATLFASTYGNNERRKHPSELFYKSRQRYFSNRTQNYSFNEYCGCGDTECGVIGGKGKVLGGTVSDNNRYPWLAFMTIGAFGKIFCGATLIGDQYLVTAAHCLAKRRIRHLPYITVHLGKHHRMLSGNTMQERKISQYWIHKGFVQKTFENDIALIKLRKPIQFTKYVKPICLPLIDDIPYGESGIVAGWGRTSERGSHSTYPREISVPIWKNSDCKKQRYHPDEIYDEMFCAGYKEGKIDACLGDSGGPLMTVKNSRNGNPVHIFTGVVSWSYGCGRYGYPGVYIRVAKYKNFLREHIYSDCKCLK